MDDPNRTLDASRSAAGALDETRASLGVSATESEPLSALALDRGAALGRYLVLDRLGAGAMGVVLSAFDPELDRKVAIKLIAARQPGKDGRARLIREARALAKLSHPNVVTVYDAGTYGGRVFIAMELVDGETLRDWLTHKHSITAILEVFRAAGTGLAAAHAAGLVHRDFKPDNVMIGRDGRVRVMDFGLARVETSVDVEPGPTLDDTSDHGDSDRTTPDLTRTGALLGTPAYMSPEQFSGAPADARTDQFAFAVTLYEALYGVRPVRADSLGALALAVMEGNIDPAPSGSTVPAPLRTTLLRALALDPGQRFPSMDELIAELHEPVGRRRSWVAAGLGVAVVASIVAGVISRDDPTATCDDVDHQLEGDWDPPARTRLAQAFQASGAVEGEATWTHVERRLGAWAQRWVEVGAPACRNQLGTELASLKLEQARCLAERRRDLHATLHAFANADVTTIGKAVAMVDGLPDPGRCSDPLYLSARVRPPDDPKLAAEVDRLADELARIKALDSAGKRTEALELVATLVEPIRATDYPPLVASLDRLLGTQALNDDHGDEAEALLYTSMLTAIRGEDSETAAQSARLLARVIGRTPVRHDEAMRWLELAAGLGQRLGEDLLWQSALASTRSSIEGWAGNNAEAETAIDEAIRLRERVEGPNSTVVMNLLKSKAVGQQRAGQFDEALLTIQRAQDIAVSELGPRHPAVGDAANTRGAILQGKGDGEAARDALLMAIDILEPSQGSTHPRVLAAHMNLGITYIGLDQFDKALEQMQTAHDALVATLPPTHLRVAQSYNNLGTLLMSLGQHDRALEDFEQARVIYAQTHGEQSLEYAEALISHAGVLAGGGDPRGSVEVAEAIAVVSQLEQAGTAPSILNYAVTADRQLGNIASARRYAEQLLALLPEGDPVARASTDADLALLALADGDVAGATRMLEQIADAVPKLEDRSTNWRLASLRLAARAGRWDEVERDAEPVSAELQDSMHGVDLVEVEILRIRAARANADTALADRRQSELAARLVTLVPGSTELSERVAALAD